ncbi:hypothetical protein Q5752_000928 [Cryptotrichosporon argae]
MSMRARRSRAFTAHAPEDAPESRADASGHLDRPNASLVPARRGELSRAALASETEAGPSRAPTSGRATPSAAAATAEGKEADAARRKLPARIRRATGGGAEGVRDLEEMIVDWLERWGEPSPAPPDDLALLLITTPLSALDPPCYTTAAHPPVPAVTATPSLPASASTSTSPRGPAMVDVGVVLEQKVIETPSWVLVRAGDDDAEEARDELSASMLSPTKRLRRGPEAMEDTSDAYYAALHKRPEALERRQRIREREVLYFERHKMRARIELLRNMPDAQWATVVGAVLARGDSVSEAGQAAGQDRDGPAAGKDTQGAARGARVAVEEKGVGWLRKRLIKEGKEVVRRYDQLLPAVHKTARLSEGRPPSSSVSSSLSPPPSVPPPAVPPRVAALRDDSPPAAKRRVSEPTRPLPRRQSVAADPPPRPPRPRLSDGPPRSPRPETERLRATPTRRSARHSGSPAVSQPELKPDPRLASPRFATTRLALPETTRGAQVEAGEPIEIDPPVPEIVKEEEKELTPPPATPPALALAPIQVYLPVAATTLRPAVVALSNGTATPDNAPAIPLTQPPTLVAQKLPCLIAAALRREGIMHAARAQKDDKSVVVPRLLVGPFGVPLPFAVELESEFCIDKVDEFIGIIAAREAVKTTSSSEDALDMEGVEAAVL